MKKAAKGQRMSFRNKYLALAISTLLFLGASAQDNHVGDNAGIDTTKKLTDVNGDGYNWKGGRFINVLRAPHGLPALARKDSGAIAWYSNRFWQFNNSGVWDTLSGGGSGGTGSPTVIYVGDDLYVIDSAGFQVIRRLHNSGLVSGGIVTSAGGLNLDVTSAVYYDPFGNRYISPTSTITLAAADVSNPRKDLIVVDTTSVAKAKTGTAAASPILPQANPSWEVSLTNIDIPIGATSLNINTKYIYQEGVTPWDTAHRGTMSVAFRNTVVPHLGTHDIIVNTFTDTSSIVFTDSGPDTVVASSVFKMFLYLTGALGTNHFQMQFLHGGVPVSTLFDISAFISPLDSNEYQNVSIPLSVFNFFGGNIFDQVVIKMAGNNLSGAKPYYLDDIQLQSGISQAPIDYSNKLDSIFTRNDSLFQYVKGIEKFRGLFTAGGVGTVTNIATGYGLTGGPITSTGTIKVDTSLLLTKLGAAAIYQPSLISGTNIKTINGSSVLGSGNLVVSGGSGITKAYAPLVVTSGGDSISQRFNVLAYIPGYVSGVTNCTKGIQAAINAADAAGGGTVFFPNGIYPINDTVRTDCNCQIIIPFRGIGDPLRGHITLLGESKPNMAPVGGGLPVSAGLTPNTTGVILKSSITTFGTAGAAVIGTNITGDLNLNFLAVENIAIQIKNNFSGGGPAIGGINLANGGSLYCKYVTVYSDTSGYESAMPTHDVTGIELPDYLGEGHNILENTLSTGFRTGYRIGSHCLLLNVGVWCCYYGVRTKIGGSTGIGSRVEAQWCAYDFYVGQNDFTFGNFNLATELIQQGKWFDHIAVLKDTANLADGQIYYQLNTAIVSPVLKIGGLRVNMLTHGEGVSSGYIGLSIFPTVTGNRTLVSTTFLGGVQATSGLILQATNGSGGTGSGIHLDVNPGGVLTEAMTIANSGFVGIGTAAPSSDLEIKSATSPTLKLNTGILNGTPILVFQKNGTNKFGVAINAQGNNLSSYSVHNYSNNKESFFADTIGNVGIGGQAITQGTASIWTDNNLNVFMDNTNFKMNTTTHGLELPTLLTVPQINSATTSLTLNPSGKVLFGTSGAYDITNGAFGVGTTSPNSSAGFGGLTLNGSSGGIMWFNVANTLTGEIFATPSQFTLRAGAGDKLSFQANNSSSDHMSISASGFVGINRAATTDFLEVAGNLSLAVAGNKLKITTGTNASIGVSGAMTAGTITISTTAVTASSKVFLTYATVAGTQGFLSVGTIVAGTSFVINSSSAIDTSSVNWWIIN